VSQDLVPPPDGPADKAGRNASVSKPKLAAVRGLLPHGLRGAFSLMVALFLIWIAVIGPGIIFTNPNPLSVANLTSELVSVRVVDGRTGAFNVAGVQMAALGKKAEGCTGGLIKPVAGSTVTFGRVALGPLEITIDPPADAGSLPVVAAIFEPGNGGPARELPGQTAIVADQSCHPPNALRMPIWGHVQIGREYVPATSADQPSPFFLLGGTIDIAAHAIYTRTLYQVASVVVPPGGRLQSSKTDEDAHAAIWWGAITVDPYREGLRVNAATESPELYIYRPNQTGAEALEIWGWMRIRSDPTVETLSIIIALIGWIYSMFKSIDQFRVNRSGSG
jgi:hypothetical protein